MNVRMNDPIKNHITSHDVDYRTVKAPDLLKVLRFSAKKFSMPAFNYCLTHCDVSAMTVEEFYDWVEEITLYGIGNTRLDRF